MSTSVPEPEVLFCNICNQSIPESALRAGLVVRLPDGGAPVVSGARKDDGAGSSGAAMSTRGAAGAVLVVVVAIVAAALYLDWRVTTDGKLVRDDLVSVQSGVEQQGGKLAAMELRLGETLRATDVDDYGARFDQVDAALSAMPTAITGEFAAPADNIRQARETLRELRDAHAKQSAQVSLLLDEMRVISRQLADLRAAPRSRIDAEPEPVPGPLVGPDPMESPPAAGGLPADLAHQVARLTDPDDGVRFEAVDALLTSGNQDVIPHILPLSKDPDPFVRRLVLEGIGDHRRADVVDTLITSLADPEAIVRFTAYGSLKKVSGESFAFDPDAEEDRRVTAQRRWQKWWDDNRSKF